MTTVINNPDSNRDGLSSGSGVAIGAALVILALVIIIVLSLPYIRSQISAMTSQPVNPTINVQLPSTPSPSVPSQNTGTLTK